MTRDELVNVVADAVEARGALLVTGNGSIARAYATLRDNLSAFYMTGSMGLCPPIAAGLASCVDIPVVALEGDGNILMGLSGLPVVAAACRGRVFVHVVADNNLYETTGSQQTLADIVDFNGSAIAAGYAQAIRVAEPDEARKAVGEALNIPGPTFIHAIVQPGTSPKHARPSLGPVELTRRFMAEVAQRRAKG